MAFSVHAETLLRELGIPPETLAARGLREQSEGRDLEMAEAGPDGRQHLLEPAAAEAWRLLKKSASEAGVTLYLVSAFRSIERQRDLFKQKLAGGQSLSQVLAVLAPPGFSEHHTGRAVDLGTPGCPPLDVSFQDTEAFRWLQHEAGRFGFGMSYPEGNAGGYQYEPWHWCRH